MRNSDAHDAAQIEVDSERRTCASIMHIELVFMHVCEPPVVTCLRDYISRFPSGEQENGSSQP